MSDASRQPMPLARVSSKDVRKVFSDKAEELHKKLDQTRDAYFGFIFPVNRADFWSVTAALDMNDDAARALYKEGSSFSSFRPNGLPGQITNHIVGASFLALRGRSLDTGLSSATNAGIVPFVEQHAAVVLEIAAARASWFGRIYFPAAAFSNAIGVFGGKVSPDAVHKLSAKYGYAATAGSRKTVRGDFGIGLWLALLGLST